VCRICDTDQISSHLHARLELPVVEVTRHSSLARTRSRSAVPQLVVSAPLHQPPHLTNPPHQPTYPPHAQFTAALEMLEDTGISAPEILLDASLGRGNARLKQPEATLALADFLAVSTRQFCTVGHRGALPSMVLWRCVSQLTN
jgi:hypothetical protein